MRALLDANIYLSYLLTSSNATTPPVVIVKAALTGRYALLLTAGVVAELRDKSENKPYLAARITQDQTEQLIHDLSAAAEIIPELPPPLPQIGNDRKDDHLFAHAVVGQADYLVSGDTGVQEIGQIADVQIVSPAMFVQILQRSGLIPNPSDPNGI